LKKRLSNIKKAIKPFKESGVAVVLYSPPVVGEIVDMIDKYGLQKQYRIYTDELLSCTTFVDLFRNGDIIGVDFNYDIDPVHSDHRKEILEYLIKDI